MDVTRKDGRLQPLERGPMERLAGIRIHEPPHPVESNLVLLQPAGNFGLLAIGFLTRRRDPEIDGNHAG
jgi:hypothetical protein